MLGDLMSHHTSTLEVAEIAKEVNAKKVVLTHLVPTIAPEDGPEKVFVRGMSDIYSGPVVVGRDNMTFTVE
jgi:ribonuclease Z